MALRMEDHFLFLYYSFPRFVQAVFPAPGLVFAALARKSAGVHAERAEENTRKGRRVSINHSMSTVLRKFS